MDDKRRHKRITVKGIYGNVLYTAKVEIINISLGGAAIHVNRSLTPGREYTIRFEEKDRQIELKGIVVWSVLTESLKGPHGDVIPIYHAGIRFDDVLTSKTAELIDFIEANKIIEGEDRLRGLRFKIHTPENTILYYPSGYKVKLISPFGMLIETMQPFRPETRFPMELFLKEGKVVRFRGRIASCIEVKDSTPKCYDIGVEFLEMYTEDKASLEAFIHSIVVDEKDRTK